MFFFSILIVVAVISLSLSDRHQYSVCIFLFAVLLIALILIQIRQHFIAFLIALIYIGDGVIFLYAYILYQGETKTYEPLRYTDLKKFFLRLFFFSIVIFLVCLGILYSAHGDVNITGAFEHSLTSPLIYRTSEHITGLSGTLSAACRSSIGSIFFISLVAIVPILVILAKIKR